MLPTLRDRPAPHRHEGLLAASAGHRQSVMSTWARSALVRSEKLLTVCAPVDTDIASQAGSALTALTPEDLHTTARPAELLQRAAPTVTTGWASSSGRRGDQRYLPGHPRRDRDDAGRPVP